MRVPFVAVVAPPSTTSSWCNRLYSRVEPPRRGSAVTWGLTLRVDGPRPAPARAAAVASHECGASMRIGLVGRLHFGLRPGAADVDRLGQQPEPVARAERAGRGGEQPPEQLQQAVGG